MPDPTPAAFPLELADLCVKCGLCLPHCPTYQLTENEAESPRGRIMLMQGLATGLLEQDSQLEKHLDQCLTCRACENVCPANVPYGELIDAGRAQLLPEKKDKEPLISRLLSFVLIHTTLRRFAGILLWGYQKSGLQFLARHTVLLGNSGLARLDPLIPNISAIKQPASKTSSTIPAQGRVGLFTGCVSEWLEVDVLQDAVALLNAIGYDVDIPESQGCCGALHQHQGDLDTSRKLAKRNMQAFSEEHAAIIGTASGCTSMLAEYSLLDNDGKAFGQLSQDISQFLIDNWPDKLNLAPLQARVAIHDPCSLRNVLKQANAPYALLQKIPGLQVSALDDNATCCGAAGNFFISQPELAEQLGQKKLDIIQAQNPDYIVTSNVGCGMQLKAQLHKAGLRTPVLHPINLMRQQLITH